MHRINPSATWQISEFGSTQLSCLVFRRAGAFLSIFKHCEPESVFRPWYKDTKQDPRRTAEFFLLHAPINSDLNLSHWVIGGIVE
jgi:hypothetical protein